MFSVRLFFISLTLMFLLLWKMFYLSLSLLDLMILVCLTTKHHLK